MDRKGVTEAAADSWISVLQPMSMLTPWIQSATLCRENSMCEEGRDSGSGLADSCSIWLGAGEDVGAMGSSRLLDCVLVEDPALC